MIWQGVTTSPHQQGDTAGTGRGALDVSHSLLMTFGQGLWRKDNRQILEYLGLAINTGHDNVVTIHSRGRSALAHSLQGTISRSASA